MTRFALSDGVLSMVLPSRWEDSSTYMFRGPQTKVSKGGMLTVVKESAIRPTLTLTREPATGKTLEKVVRDYVAESERQLSKYKVLGQVERKIGDTKGIEIEVVYLEEASNVVLQGFQVFVPHNDEVFVLSLATLPALFGEHSPMFTQILDSIQWDVDEPLSTVVDHRA